MEVDGQATLRAGAAAYPTAGVNAVRPEAAEREVFFSNQQTEVASRCLKAMKPVRYAGEPDPERLDEFITFLQWHFCFCPCSENEKVLVAACYLDGAALKWWTQQYRANPRPLEIRTLQAFTDRLVEQFMPKSIRFEASEKLLKIKQGNLSISQYIDRFQTLLRQAFEMSPQFQYQCFMRGLNPSARDALAAHVRHSTTGVWPGLEEISAFFLEKRR